jgi:thiamine kinase-like enzyme
VTVGQADPSALLAAAIPRVPELRGADPASAVRLAGLTNLNFRIATAGGTYVLRIPGAGTSEYIDRRAEEVAARSTARAGVNAEIVHFDPSDGLMVTRFVDGAVTMSPDALRDLGAVARAGEVLRRLHRDADRFAIDFRLFPVIDDYKGILDRRSAPMPEGWEESRGAVEATRAALERVSVPLVPSHCDPLCENFLDTGERMYLIDFEYGGNNDPMWDLGDLSVEGGFDAAQDRALMRAYFGHDPAAADVGRMVAYKAMCDVLWALWGMVQHVNDNPVEDFLAYANRRYARCMALMGGPDYGGHLRAITGS